MEKINRYSEALDNQKKKILFAVMVAIFGILLFVALAMTLPSK
jgi:hypothetical protein